MPATQGASTLARVQVTPIKAQGLLNAALPVDISTAISFANGTGAGQVNAAFYDVRTIAASGTDSLDLNAVLTDALGVSLIFTKVKFIYIVADPGNTNNVVVGAAGSNPFIGLLNATGTITLRPGMGFLAFAGLADATGMAVTAATGDLLLLTNSSSGTGVKYTIVIGGVSS